MNSSSIRNPLHAPSDEALQAVLHKIITRMMKLLTRRGALVEGRDVHG